MPHPTPGGPSLSLTIDAPTAGGPRTYLLNLPSGYSASEPSPLIVAFHGKGQDGTQFERETQLTDPAFNTLDAIIAFPNGINKQWIGDPESPPRHEQDDIAFARELLTHLLEHYSIARERVYIVGFSNGGGLTSLLSCDRTFSASIAAAAIVSGAVYKDKSLKGDEQLFDKCEPARSPLPILEMHGSKDPVIHYDGKSTPDGETYPIKEWLAGWRKRNGCNEETRSESMDIHNDSVKKSVWWNNKDQEAVVHYFIKGFGHGWPSVKKQDDDNQRYGPLKWNGTKDIVSFFESKRLP